MIRVNGNMILVVVVLFIVFLGPACITVLLAFDVRVLLETFRYFAFLNLGILFSAVSLHRCVDEVGIENLSFLCAALHAETYPCCFVLQSLKLGYFLVNLIPIPVNEPSSASVSIWFFPSGPDIFILFPFFL